MNTARRLTGLGQRRRRWTRDQIQVTNPEAMRRSIRGASIGNFMEWYDFGVYGYIATTIAQVFYPGDSVSAVHLIATFSTFAAAFVVRPVGGFIFGPLGDRIGRKRVLVITIVLMTVGTTGTGLLPGYSAIGVWAPILLVVARVFQGLSTGGEYVGAMTYVVEQAPDRKRGMVVGFLPLGNLAGFVAAGLIVTGLQTWLPSQDMLTWGWRVPLLLSAPLGLVAVFMRLRLEESPAYHNKSLDAEACGDGQQYGRTIAEQWKPMLICAALVFLTGYTSVNAVVKAELFPTGVRALGVALPYALANAVFGGTAEYAALAFKQAGNEGGFFIYVGVVMAAAAVTAFFMGDPRHLGLIDD